MDVFNLRIDTGRSTVYYPNLRPIVVQTTVDINVAVAVDPFTQETTILITNNNSLDPSGLTEFSSPDIETDSIVWINDNSVVRISAATLRDILYTAGDHITIASGAINFDTSTTVDFLVSPTAPTPSLPDSSTKVATTAFVNQLVSAVSSGLDVKASVQLLATSNIDISNPGAIDIDGVTPSAGYRLGLIGQTDAEENGIYIWQSAADPLIRAADVASDENVTQGLFFFTTEGVQWENTGWILTTPDPIELDVTPLSFTQFTGSGDLIVHTGLLKSGSELSIDYTIVAALFSPAFTGSPTVPTPSTNDYSTLIASTAFVVNYVQLQDYVTALTAPVTSVAGRGGAVSLVVADITGAAPLFSPGFSGVPTAPTPLTSDDSTTISTTAFVKNQAYATLDSPALTGSPTAPTVLSSDDSTAIATTAFVKATTINISGDASGSGTPADISITLASTGVSDGTYTKLTINSKGLVTEATQVTADDVQNLTNGTTLFIDEFGVLQIDPTELVNVSSAAQLTNDFSLSATGAATGSVGINGSADVELALTLSALSDDLNFNGFAGINALNPVDPQDVATKSYVDTSLQGLKIKPSADAATTEPLPGYVYDNGASGVGATITAMANGLLTIDGLDADTPHPDALRFLIKDETDSWHNGLYYVVEPGSISTQFQLARDPSMDESDEFEGALIVVDQDGDTNNNTLWIASFVGNMDVGTTELSFVNINPAVHYSYVSGLTQTGRNISVDFSIVAALISPALAGTPTAPTPTTNDNSTLIATTAYVKNQAYATLASPTFIGTPAAPTPLTADNSTTIATTAYVKNQAYATLASPALTGSPTAPTPAANDNSTLIATTAYVITQVGGTSFGYNQLPAQVQNSVASIFIDTPQDNHVIYVGITQNTTLPANFSGTITYCGARPLSDAVFSVSYIRSGVTTPIGTLTFTSSSDSATLSTQSSVNLLTGDILVFTQPHPADASLASVAIDMVLLKQ